MHVVPSLPQLIRMVLTGMGAGTGTTGLTGHINQRALRSHENCYLIAHNNLLSPANATAPELSYNLVFLLPKIPQWMIYVFCQYCTWPTNL